MLTDVAFAQRAQQRIAERVQQHVAVGMRHHAAVVRHPHPAERDEFARPEGMHVVAMTDAHRPASP